MIVIADISKQVETLGAFPLPGGGDSPSAGRPPSLLVEETLIGLDVLGRECGVRWPGNAPYVDRRGDFHPRPCISTASATRGQLSLVLTQIPGVVGERSLIDICDILVDRAGRRPRPRARHQRGHRSRKASSTSLKRRTSSPTSWTGRRQTRRRPGPRPREGGFLPRLRPPPGIFPARKETGKARSFSEPRRPGMHPAGDAVPRSFASDQVPFARARSGCFARGTGFGFAHRPRNRCAGPGTRPCTNWPLTPGYGIGTRRRTRRGCDERTRLRPFRDRRRLGRPCARPGRRRGPARGWPRRGIPPWAALA